MCIEGDVLSFSLKIIQFLQNKNRKKCKIENIIEFKIEKKSDTRETLYAENIEKRKFV